MIQYIKNQKKIQVHNLCVVGVQSIKPIPGNEGGGFPGFWRISGVFDHVENIV
jgi:hypothetical protein